MKIEMAESLGASWLKHVKMCQLVQTNWKKSSQWHSFHDGEMQGLFDGAREFFTQHAIRVFRQMADVDQFLRQAECDVVGVSYSEQGSSYHVAEIAFHAAGLDGDYADRVASKMIRAAFVLYNYFNVREGNIYFITPRTRPAVKNRLAGVIDLIRQYFGDNGFAYEFTFVTNEDFRNLVLNPVLNLADLIADTGELFLRAYQLMALFEDSPDENEVPNPQEENQGDGAMGVGRLAQREIPPIIERLDPESQEIADLQDRDTCHQIFRLNYPLLVTERNENNRKHYYAEPIVVGERQFWMCNEWHERNRGPLEDWIDQHIE